ncbi:MAG: SDR family oxidoreductase [Candidatus Altiarchaeota archaeon]|nr:SDR family oxidoreductase [Candidatus Altiarchaeota archaeon]
MTVSLVTGGCGFIGSSLSMELARRGHDVRVIDNLLTGKGANLHGQDNISLIEGDIRDIDLLKREFEGVDYVFHQAAISSVSESVADPFAINDNNVNGTLNVLIAARDCNVTRVVYASSSSVYGDAQALPNKEEAALNPMSPYAVSKLAGEYYCKVFSRIYGLETVILRYFNVFGPRQDPMSRYAAVIPKFITSMIKDQPPEIFGDGLQSRDFVYVKDVAEANILASSAENVAAQEFNIACGGRITLNRLVDELNAILGKELKPVYLKERKGDIRHSYADISKAGGILGYSPACGFGQGLAETVKWFSADVI